MIALNCLTSWPLELQTISSDRLIDVLHGPTLIELEGRRREPVFVSILLHGNEDVGLVALQQLFARVSPESLPRSLTIFIGNVSAAAAKLRRLDGQVDYNRVWPGTEHGASAERKLMQDVFERMSRRRVFASIDLHNNTGLNPLYACINRVDSSSLHLASLFSRTVVYFTRPRGVQSAAFSLLCPSVTCECGKVGDSHGAARASEFLEAVLHLSEFPHQEISSSDVHLFHTVATVKIPEHVSFGFTGGDAQVEINAEVQFDPELERLNFQELAAGQLIARRKKESSGRLVVYDPNNEIATDGFLYWDGDNLRLKRDVMPSMLTCDARVIRQDCLGYFMQRWQMGEAEALS